MKSHHTLLFSTLSSALALAACGGSGGDNAPEQVVITDPRPEVSFFNDDAKTGYVDAMIGRFVSIFRPLSSLSDGVLAKRTIAMTELETLSCTDGGSIALSLTGDPATTSSLSASVSFDNCMESGEASNGSISFSANLDETNDNGTINFSADNFTVTGGDEDVSINGAVTVQMQSDAGSSTFSLNGSEFSLTAGAESISISNYNITAIQNDAAGSGSLSAAMTVSSSVDGTVTFSVDPPLTGSDTADYPDGGAVTMTHSDGSSLTLNADNGDPATFSYTINDNGVVTTGVQRWADTDISDL